MLALGVTLLVSVAAPPLPTAHAAAEKLASTYDEAYCDAADGGECAEEDLLELSLPAAPPAILDCASPFIAEMIGTCDLPRPTMPSLHLPTVRNGSAGLSVARNGSSERLSVVANGSSLDAAIALHDISLAPPPVVTQSFAFRDTGSNDAPRSRLDRPPRS
jgi:hypothetical protein